MKSELQSNTEQDVNLAHELQLVKQALLLLEARIDEQESRVNGLAALLQQQVKDLKIVIQGYETLSKILKAHHDMIKSIAMSLPARKTPSTLQ